MGSKKGYFFKKKLTLFAFVLPGAAFMTIMIIFPIISNIIMSFKNVDLMNFATGDSHFVGLKIYQKICTALQFKRFRFGPLFNPQWNEPRDGRNVPQGVCRGNHADRR